MPPLADVTTTERNQLLLTSAKSLRAPPLGLFDQRRAPAVSKSEGRARSTAPRTQCKTSADSDVSGPDPTSFRKHRTVQVGDLIHHVRHATDVDRREADPALPPRQRERRQRRRTGQRLLCYQVKPAPGSPSARGIVGQVHTGTCAGASGGTVEECELRVPSIAEAILSSRALAKRTRIVIIPRSQPS